MNVTSTNASSPVGSIVVPAATPNAGKQALGQSDFMKLLAAQLSAQDPMNPMKDTEFIAQMANFSSLDSMRTLSSSFASFASDQRAAALPQFLGKEVTLIDEEGAQVTGTVTEVKMSDGNAGIVVNNQTYDPSSIISVHSAPAASSSSLGSAPTIPPSQP